MNDDKAMKRLPLTLYAAVAFLAAPVMLTGTAAAQNITCTDKACRGTDIMGNPVLLEVHSGRLDRTQSYTARIGDNEIQVERRRSPLVSAGWNGPALLQRPITTITGEVDGEPVNLYTESLGLTTGEAFGRPITCAVNGWSVFDHSACF
jgi:hypothetical protein